MGSASTAGDPAAYLAGLGDRYDRSRRVIALDEWRAYCAAPEATAAGERVVAEEVAAARAERSAFFADAAIDRRLADIAGSESDEEIRAWARAWRRFRDERRPEADPAVVALRDRILAVTRARDTARAVGVLLGAGEADERDRALALLSARLEELRPLIAERARRLDAVGKQLGYDSFADLRPGSRPLPELRRACARQIASTADGWNALRGRARDRLGRELTLADTLALATGWTAETSTFYRDVAVAASAERILARAGIDLPALAIDVGTTSRPGGRAFAIDIPGDVRFCGSFPPGYDGVRGYLHELGHAIHMTSIRPRRQPYRAMPTDTGLAEGIGEIFSLWARDRQVLPALFPDLAGQEVDAFEDSVDAFEAASVRHVCLHAVLERELVRGPVSSERWSELVDEMFGLEHAGDPVWILMPYLDSPLHVEDYVWAREIRDTFVARLGEVGLVTPEATDYLRAVLLAPGNALSSAEWLASAPDLAAWRRSPE